MTADSERRSFVFTRSERWCRVIADSERKRCAIIAVELVHGVANHG